ncbi:tyrosine-type recombinase/integrase [Bacillus badius]|uniref:tyrosine-type recombinase/integrase n=1 Tax=Bacillus badius TaxID=1455 RepID=UPI0005ADA2C0|nr:tyrosine-type recombinase/integrase [Bacillus badius]KIL74355.1 Tyrosine recombinase XerC [Bacillus badius]
MKKSDMKVHNLKVINGSSDFFKRFELNQLDKGKAVSTVDVYVRELKKLDEWLQQSNSNIEDITRFDVQQYMKHLEQLGRSASTIDRIFGVIGVLSKYINRPNIIEDINRVKKQKVTKIAPKSLERNEVHSILRKVEKDGNLRNVAIVYMLAFTGVRIGELVALSINDIDLRKNGNVTVIGKGNKERKVPVPKEARYHIQRYLDTREDDNEALFLSNYNKRMSKRSAQRIIEKYGHHAHELRHTYCRNLIKKGFDIVTVSQLAGHETIEVTKRYTMASENELNIAIDDLYV